MKVVIDRTKWIRGNQNLKNDVASVLLDEKTGCMCCMGFYALACGVEPEQIANRYDLNDDNLGNRFLIESKQSPIAHNTACREKIYNINDTKDIDDENLREETLKEIVAKYGVEFEFIN